MNQQEADKTKLHNLLDALLSARAAYQSKLSEDGSLVVGFESAAAFYKEQFDNIRTTLIEELVRIHITDDELWSRLDGDAVNHGSARIDVLANYLKKFKTVAGHGVGSLKSVPHKGGRFSGEIEASTAYRFIGTGPGSLRVGLAMPEPTPIELPNNPNTTTGDSELDHLILKAINPTTNGRAAIYLIELALAAGADDNAFEELKKLVDTHGSLRMLYHVPKLFPSGVDTIELEGDMIRTGAARFDSSVKQQVRERASSLLKDEKYVSGVGFMAVNKWLDATFELTNLNVTGMPSENKVVVRYDSDKFDIKPFADRTVFFEGFMAFDLQGKPKEIKLDSIDLGDNDADLNDED